MVVLGPFLSWFLAASARWRHLCCQLLRAASQQSSPAPWLCPWEKPPSIFTGMKAAASDVSLSTLILSFPRSLFPTASRVILSKLRQISSHASAHLSSPATVLTAAGKGLPNLYPIICQTSCPCPRHTGLRHRTLNVLFPLPETLLPLHVCVPFSFAPFRDLLKSPRPQRLHVKLLPANCLPPSALSLHSKYRVPPSKYHFIYCIY